MHGDAADAVSTDFDLTEMYPSADPEIEPGDTAAERTGADVPVEDPAALSMIGGSAAASSWVQSPRIRK